MLDDKNYQEVWTGKKPFIKHLREFGCDYYVHVPKENRDRPNKKV